MNIFFFEILTAWNPWWRQFNSNHSWNSDQIPRLREESHTFLPNTIWTTISLSSMERTTLPTILTYVEYYYYVHSDPSPLVQVNLLYKDVQAYLRVLEYNKYVFVITIDLHIIIVVLATAVFVVILFQIYFQSITLV